MFTWKINASPNAELSTWTLLSQIKEVEHPVIVAGDLNTSGTDGTPTSIRREILNRVKNYEF
jgi:hypothetical protein